MLAVAGAVDVEADGVHDEAVEDGSGDGCVAQVAPPVGEIVAGYAHVCAQKLDGTVWCWGNNEYAQLGDGTTGGDVCSNGKCKSTPVQAVIPCN